MIKMITEDYCNFDIAKLLKEKGFNEKCRALYTVWFDEVEGPKEDETENWNIEPKYFSAPTLQMTMKWLREKEWFICIIPLAFYCGEKAVKFGYNIWAGDNIEIDEFDTPKFNTYEEACEAAIKYCLENLI